MEREKNRNLTFSVSFVNMEEWKKEYFKLLEDEKKLFGWKYKIELDEKFDPRRWVRSYFDSKKPSIRWSNLDFYEECLEEEKSIDIWLLIPSKEGEKNHELRIKYRPIYKIYNNLKYYPYEFEHSCDDTFSTGTSGHPVYCKHLYKALLFIDEEITPKYREIVKSTFKPNDRFLNETKKIENERIPAVKKIELIFDAMEKYLTLEEGFKLGILNKRLSKLNKV